MAVRKGRVMGWNAVLQLLSQSHRIPKMESGGNVAVESDTILLNDDPASNIYHIRPAL